ncbi:TIGR01459 family HAD-type hydrolase [Oricola cellulosilytica]|uniref:TIGR01459 family HAD-type hydrolase n=1 Tax=Oricola cellulosilytica TaxID=1429082 RepID=A0A4R0PFL4_9HYPH|nr:TIGR01459 family HAD-type hydrolase [Oricola cellulosilytica]TCD16635.1 TIGR01459 family HAD-type hydrolase [Oricola cellulosilytica]
MEANLGAPRIEEFGEISDRYDVILCDVWGVLHNGVRAWTPAWRALAAAREQGKAVVLITNAPRPKGPVSEQLASLGIPDSAYDDIVTSGDVTRTLIRQNARRIFHIGPERDESLYDGLDVEMVEEREASSVVCTGFYDDETEEPGDYAEMLQRLRARDLPFICANPDIVVERGDRLVYCAGALARDYGQLGGRTLIAGKPHRPIYDEALARASKALGREADPERTLAIGDGLTTDVKGAMDYGLDLLFITEGIHAREYGEPGNPDPEKLARFLGDFGARPVATMLKLR